MGDTSVKVREASTDDIDAIRDVARRSWEETYSNMLHDEAISETIDDWYSRGVLLEEIEMSNAVFLVAEDESEVIGFLHGAIDEEGDQGHVLRIYVDPDHRRKGAGESLFEMAHDEIGKRGVETLKAMTFKQNDVGNSFYSRLGLEKTDEGEVEIGEKTFVENIYSTTL